MHVSNEYQFCKKLNYLNCCHIAVVATGADADSIGLGGRIINGTLANLNVTKHQVSIRRRVNDQYFFGGGHICGGSLIEPNVVLSAAHCFVK